MEKCNLLFLSQRNDLIRICEIIPRKTGNVSSSTRRKSKIKILPVEIVAYKDCTRWGLEKWDQWVEHLLGWILAQVSHLYISDSSKKRWCPFVSLMLQRRSTSGRGMEKRDLGVRGRCRSVGLLCTSQPWSSPWVFHTKSSSHGATWDSTAQKKGCSSVFIHQKSLKEILQPA